MIKKYRFNYCRFCTKNKIPGILKQKPQNSGYFGCTVDYVFYDIWELRIKRAAYQPMLSELYASGVFVPHTFPGFPQGGFPCCDACGTGRRARSTLSFSVPIETPAPLTGLCTHSS